MGTGFLVQRGDGGAGSGYADLQIVGGTERPAKPTPGMIWANTPNEITSYVLSATQPEAPVEGMLWLMIGDSGSNKIPSPVGKEWITLYPLFAEQYVGGAWVDVTAMSYQGGKWDRWFTYLYRAGDKCINLTGGWTEVIPTTGTTKSTISWNADCLEILTTSATSRYASVYTKNPINVDDFTRLYVRISNLSFDATNGRLAIGLRSTPYTGTTVTDLATAFPASIQQTASNSDEQLLLVELDELSGEFYIQAAIGIGDVKISEMYLL